jgi:nucleoside-diphosphate-sugar epimerase
MADRRGGDEGSAGERVADGRGTDDDVRGERAGGAATPAVEPLRVLVLGASGFVGRHVVLELLARGHAVEGWSRRAWKAPAGVALHAADLLDPESFTDRRGPWDAVVHLAAHAVPGAVTSDAIAEENVRATRHALDHARRTSPGARFLLASSAAVYGTRAEPWTEEDELAPRGRYGASKRRSEELLERAQALDGRIARLFNQVGPGMPAGLALSDLAARIARGDDPVRMKGADAVRDYLDVRDGAAALVRILEAPAGGTWNVASGVPRRISDVANGLATRLRRPLRLTFAAEDPDPLVGSRAKLERELGWRPRIPFERTLDGLAQWIAGGRCCG